MKINTAVLKMREGKPALGGIAAFGSPLGAEILALAGLDFVMADDQHGIWEPESMMAAFRSIRVAGSVPVARVGKNDFYAIGSTLDRGALGIVVPMVHTVEDAEAAAYAMRYPPRGGRSAGPYGCFMYGYDYSNWANDEVFLAVQIESEQGLENVEEIMAVDGVDGCWVGPGDLGLSLDVAPGSEAHEKALVRIVEACHKTGKIPGIASGNAEQTAHRIKQGYLFVTPTSDLGPVITDARQVIEALKDLPG
jgi:4-hydroxy-2-oxoheptanedioate aldolase